MRAAGVVYRDHDQNPALAPWIASYWSLSVSHAGAGSVLTVPPEGCAHLAFCEGRGFLLGPRIGPLRTPAAPGTRCFGIRFRPGAARAFLGLPATMPLRHALEPVDELEGLEWAARLARDLASHEPLHGKVAIADGCLLSRAAFAREPDPALRNAIGLILASVQQPAVRFLAGAAGLSQRQFRRRFTAAVDLSPKELSRVWRFRRCALEAFDRGCERCVHRRRGDHSDCRDQDDHNEHSDYSGHSGHNGHSWAAHAFRHGYSDQSHLIREFRRLVGLGPAELARRISAIELTASAWASPPPSGGALQRRAKQSPATGRRA